MAGSCAAGHDCEASMPGQAARRRAPSKRRCRRDSPGERSDGSLPIRLPSAARLTCSIQSDGRSKGPLGQPQRAPSACMLVQTPPFPFLRVVHQRRAPCVALHIPRHALEMLVTFDGERLETALIQVPVTHAELGPPTSVGHACWPSAARNGRGRRRTPARGGSANDSRASSRRRCAIGATRSVSSTTRWKAS